MCPTIRATTLCAAFGVFAAVGVAQERRTDEAIHGWVEEALRLDPAIDSSAMKVEVKDGVVKLRGSCRNLSSKDRALAETSKIDGVIGLVDELSVSSPWRADEDIAQDVRQRLALNPSLTDSGVRVTVDAGVVSLEGATESYSERMLAEMLAREVSGVLALNSHLDVHPAIARSDADVERDAAAHLALDAYLCEYPVKVTVEKGVVRLSGDVGSYYTKTRAETECRWIRGVTGVLNDLTVVAWENRGTRQEPPKFTDAEVRANVREELSRDARIAAQHVEIDAREGHVTLSGSLPTQWQRSVAIQDAKDVVGVNWVSDHLMVATEPRSDASVAESIRADLRMDSLLKDQDVVVTCRDGVVSLTGRVANAYEHEHAERVAARHGGVVRTVNELAYPRSSVLSDAVIQRRVRDRLEWNWATHPVASKLEVAVNAGVVTLTGDCDTWSQREQAMLVALGTEGVERAIDRVKLHGVLPTWPEWESDWFPPYDLDWSIHG